MKKDTLKALIIIIVLWIAGMFAILLVLDDWLSAGVGMLYSYEYYKKV